MTTDGGGWTLVHTKTSVSFIPWKATHDPLCGAITSANFASAVHNKAEPTSGSTSGAVLTARMPTRVSRERKQQEIAALQAIAAPLRCG